MARCEAQAIENSSKTSAQRPVQRSSACCRKINRTLPGAGKRRPVGCCCYAAASKAIRETFFLQQLAGLQLMYDRTDKSQLRRPPVEKPRKPRMVGSAPLIHCGRRQSAAINFLGCSSGAWVLRTGLWGTLSSNCVRDYSDYCHALCPADAPATLFLNF